MSKKILLIFLILAGINDAKSQFISEILEYRPAPGQFINTGAWGLPSSANSLAGGLNGSLSLGAFGGYVVFKFDNPVKNERGNPYGIDFVIYGNPLTNYSSPGQDNKVTWSEPGIVSVMKDENNNGLPDDTWYELAGCDYFFTTTIKNYEVTYVNPGGNTAADVPWSDNQGNSGYVYANSFLTQSYYPLPENFPDIDAVQYSLKGTRIKDFVERSNEGAVIFSGRPWGYVDNHLKTKYNGLPDNPYTGNINEGSGGDAFDMDWAVDANGNYVDLDEIDFVKVHNGSVPEWWEGEVSTEITGAFDVAPARTEAGWDSVSLVLNDIPELVSVGKSFQLEAVLFNKGRKTDVDYYEWTAGPAPFVFIDENNRLTTTGSGKVSITCSCSYEGKMYTRTMETTIIAPASVDIVLSRFDLQQGHKYPVDAVVNDQWGGNLQGLAFEWETSNTNVSVIEEAGNYYLASLQPGNTRIYVSPAGYPGIRDSVDVTILEASDPIAIYLTIKTNKKTFLPKTRIHLSNFDLRPFISDPISNYSPGQIGNITAAHAVASVFENISFESDLRFRDTEENGLYIYKLPVRSGSQTTNYYGYANNVTNGMSCWMVKTGDKTWYENLEKVMLFDDDEVVVYYVEDITKNWEVYSLIAPSDVIPAGTAIDVILNKEIYYWYSETTIVSDGAVPMPGEPIYINGEVLMEQGDTVKTNIEGHVSLTLSQPGFYNIKAATEQAELVVDNSTGFQNNVTGQLKVYPNPANEKLILQVPFLNGNAIVNVYDLTGKHIISLPVNHAVGNFELNTSGWDNGIYILQFAGNEFIFDRKVIINH